MFLFLRQSRLGPYSTQTTGSPAVNTQMLLFLRQSRMGPPTVHRRLVPCGQYTDVPIFEAVSSGSPYSTQTTGSRSSLQ